MPTKTIQKGDKKMMKNVALKENETPIVDLAKIEGDGSFPCPKCGTLISPDDESEEVYQIVDTKVVNDELVELIISCRTCGTTIKLVGFQ
jgi:predicted RNA-binding Zn-ribbon protein involved in translation (DUF1610 family)